MKKNDHHHDHVSPRDELIFLQEVHPPINTIIACTVREKMDVNHKQ